MILTGGDPGEGAVQLRRRQRRGLARPHPLAAEAEPAVDGADVGQLQQHPVRVTVHDPRDRRVDVIADRIGQLVRLGLELGRVRNELAPSGSNR